MSEVPGVRGMTRAMSYPVPCKCARFYNIPPNRDYDPLPFWELGYASAGPGDPWSWLADGRWLESLASGTLCRWRWDPLSVGPLHQIIVEFEAQGSPDPITGETIFIVFVNVRGVQNLLVTEWQSFTLATSLAFNRGTALNLLPGTFWEAQGPPVLGAIPPPGELLFTPRQCQPGWYRGKPRSGPPPP